MYRQDEAGGTESSELEGNYEVNDVPIQRWNLDNGSGLERLPLHVYMPKQTPQAIIIYFPGAGTLNNETRHEVGYDEMFVVEFARSGYVVCWPTFDGTLERRGPGYDWGTVEARLRITWAREVGRAVTFMRERYPKLPLVFAGFSMGGAYGPQAMVTNPGFDAAVLLSAGFHQTPSPRPETLEVNFLPRVSVPTLVINGRFDEIFPVHVSQEPFFEQLGRQHNIQKEMRILETGHGIPIDESIEIADAWLLRVFADIANSKVHQL